MESRGIVVVPDYKPSGNIIPGIKTTSQLQIDKIKRYLMYWDKIDLSDNPIMYMDIPRQSVFLAQAGILSKTRLPGSLLSGKTMEEKFISNYMEVFRRHDAEEPGLWTMGQSGSSWSLPTIAEQPGRGILVELFNALPFPGDSLSLEDVLSFKQKRASELISLRISLDTMYQDIINSPDIEHAVSLSKAKLEQSLSDLNKAASESLSSRIMQDLVVELRPAFVIGGAGVGVTAGAGFSPHIFPMVIGGLVGAVGTFAASGLKVTFSKKTFFNKLPDNLKALSYLYKPVFS